MPAAAHDQLAMSMPEKGNSGNFATGEEDELATFLGSCSAIILNVHNSRAHGFERAAAGILACRPSDALLWGGLQTNATRARICCSTAWSGRLDSAVETLSLSLAAGLSGSGTSSVRSSCVITRCDLTLRPQSLKIHSNICMKSQAAGGKPEQR